MANKTCGHLGKCGCETYLTTPPPCPTPDNCPDTQPCSEVFEAQCIVYTGDPIVCNQDTVVATNDNVESALEAIVNYFCENAAEPVLVEGLQCPEQPIGTVSPQGTPMTEAMQDIVNFFCPLIPQYTLYSALLNQLGTGNPVPTVLGINTIGNIVWTRINTGEYEGTLTGAFNPSTTAIILGPNTVSETGAYVAGVVNNDTIYIRTYYTDLANNMYIAQDDWLYNTFIEIRTY